MPRVKIDYVVSFSSESPDAPASNLLASEAGRGRWLCARGEASSSVLLQLARCVKISSITIGVHHAALVEVLVGRSETPNEPFKVLVASSVFLSPMESRKVTEGDAAADKVRTFSTQLLADDVRVRRWDRVRVVCSQPYNKHCKYGLSFIHIFSPEDETRNGNASIVLPNKPFLNIPLALDPQDSDDDDEFKPGALFAQHRAASQSSDNAGSTDAQIRQATSQVMKNLSDSSAKIVRTPIAKPRGEASISDERGSCDRRREQLMYADEDAQPHDKIDKLVAAHKDEQIKHSERASKEIKQHQKDREKIKPSKDKKEPDSSKDKIKDRDRKTKDDYDHRKDDSRHKRERSSSNKQKRDEETSVKKQKVLREQDTEKASSLHAGPISDEPHTLLRDVVFVLSGYENPRRAVVRDAALAMGARFHRDWGPDCTHLICAFPNTPKLKAVRSSSNGSTAVVVTAEWIERCAARRRRLPWQWFATEVKQRVQRARSASGEDPPGVKDSTRKAGTPDSECDTDDEIERVLQIQKTQRDKSPDKGTVSRDSPAATTSKQQRTIEDVVNSSHDSDVAFLKDERMKGNVTVSDSDTDTDDTEPGEKDEEMTLDLSTVEGLPSFFEGQTFALHTSTKPLLDEALVRRYVRAYGGEIVEPHDDEDIEVDYVLCLSGTATGVRARGRLLRADWLWRCHQRRQLCPPGEYALA